MTQVEKLLSIARAEIGVAEDPLGSNKTKYGMMYGRNGVEWCVIFVWCCFFVAGLSHLFYDGKHTASSTTLMNWARSKGQFVTGGYQKGDVFCYQFDADEKAEHVGIYTGQVDGRGRYLVIEGNHNNRVEVVARSDSELWGAFRPEWEEEPAEVPQPTPSPAIPASSITLPVLSKGATGDAVKAMQILLMGWGYKLPRYGADGEYGAETRTALCKFQLNKGLVVDGICGKSTWAKLLGLN